ncbi:MAG: hypothetical protein ACE37B_22115 [Ilumatobacter sp.]|jgi:hypothetical protein|uniref:hypothetical protein n=1 Tax=Ilumatobacter sp. TaxID=1967498 RepID=UPI00391CEBC3
MTSSDGRAPDPARSDEPTDVGAADASGSAATLGLVDPGIDAASIEAEEMQAQRRLSAIEAGRRKGGVAGAAMAGAMVALSEIYEGPKRDEIVAVSESPDEPTDIDADGIRVDVGDVTVESKLPDE